MRGYIDLKKLNLEELVGVVNLYPWFGGARKELGARMSRMGGHAWGESQYAEAAMYIPSREILSDIMRASRTEVLTDDDMQVPPALAPTRRVYAGAGDYFSQEDYDKVRRADDNPFSRYSFKADDVEQERAEEVREFDIFTETLAQIYAEQGYYEQAKDIYSKLILAYPEKSAYFASLIQKMDESN